MSAGQLQKDAEDAAFGLTGLATGYGLLFEHLTPSSMGGGSVGSAVLGPKPPLSPHVLDVIGEVEVLACWAEAQVCAWLAEPWQPYRPWWNGEPCPLVPESMLTAARRLPQAAEYAGNEVSELARYVWDAEVKVRGVIGRSDPSELLGTVCPRCQSRTLVRLSGRVCCAIPGCNYETKRQS